MLLQQPSRKVRDTTLSGRRPTVKREMTMGTDSKILRELLKPLFASVLALAILACSDGPPTAAEVEPSLFRGGVPPASPRPWGFVATASFHHASLETCYETVAEVTVTEAPGDERETTLDFRYYVLGICDDQQGLFFIDLHTGGEVPIDSSDFTVHPGLRSATLDTEIEVFDEESATFGTIQVQVTWEYTRNRGGPPTLRATLEYSGNFTQHPGVNPISTDEAELRRFRP